MSIEADEAVARLQELLARVEADVKARLSALDTASGATTLERTRGALAVESRVRAQIVAELRRRRVDVVTILSDAALAAARREAARVSLDVVPADTRRMLRRVIDERTDDIFATFDDASVEVGRAVRAGVVSGGDLSDLIADVAGVVRTSFLRAQAAVDAGVMAASRAATMDLAATAEATTRTRIVYVYAGPDDRKTRPFCDEHVGRAYTREALDRLDNGAKQPKPTSLYLGGYNCRHNLAPLPEDVARARGITIVE